MHPSRLNRFQLSTFYVCLYRFSNLLRMKELLKQNKYYYITCLILFACTSVLLLFQTKTEVTAWVNAHYNLWLDKFVLAVDKMGTLPFAVIILALLWIFKGRKVALYALICFVSVSLVTTFLKYIIFPGTPRPTVLLEDILPLRLLEGVVQRKTESFPSGHTSSAFAIATFFALVFSRKRLHVLFALFAAAVGYARIYLSQHFITDVYVGMIIGVVLTTLIYWWLSRRGWRIKGTRKQKEQGTGQ